MPYNSLPLFKSHFSLGKSILTLEEPPKKPYDYPISIFDLLKQNQLDTLVLVEDNISGLLQASKNADKLKIKLIFGLRLDICEDINQKDESSLMKRAKYVIFAKNIDGYKSLIKIWSLASQEGFYYSPNMDFKTLKSLWNKNLVMSVPFYDSFLHLNTLHSHLHVPDIDAFRPITFFIENNEMPFDDLIEQKVKHYCLSSHYQMIPAQSIFYKSPEDYLAYLTFKCIHNRGHSQKSTLEKPELEHMNSDQFSFDKWFENNI